MELNLQRPLLFFDIESTGLNIAADCICELSFVKVFPGGETRIKTWRFKPWDYLGQRQYPIAPQASAVNGIKDEDLADCPRFCDQVEEVVQWLEDADLAGFNSAKFDLPMLAEEIERARLYMHKDIDIDLHSKLMVDDFENAHSAEADTLATYRVLKGQLDMYPDRLKNDVTALASVTGRPRTVDYAGRLILGENGEAVVSFGKHKGKTAREVWRTEPAYFAWIEGGDFTLDTKRQFARLKAQFQKEQKEQREAQLNRPATPDELQDLASRFNTGKLF